MGHPYHSFLLRLKQNHGKGDERMEELDYRAEGCEMFFFYWGGWLFHSWTCRSCGGLHRVCQDRIHQHTVMDGWEVHMTLPLPRELLTVDGCCRGKVIFFSGIATGQLSTFQWIAPHPCPHRNTWLNSASHATKQKQNTKTWSWENSLRRRVLMEVDVQ